MNRNIFHGLWTFVAFGALAALPGAAAQDFYAGKTITLITSTGGGGSYDVGARAIARHMPRFLPGKPNIIVQNMPGAGNVLATNFMYEVASKDGTHIAVIHPAMPLHQVLDGRGVRYDAGKFQWIGSVGPSTIAVLVWHTAGIKTLEDVTKKEVILGGTGQGSVNFMIPTVMNKLLGTKFKIVVGYPGSEDVNLAMQRGEIEARTFGIVGLKTVHGDWLTDKKIDIIAQAGSKRDRDLSDVPLLTELAKTDEDKQIMALISSPSGLGKPYIAPPEIPQDRLALLRKAFITTLTDKEFRAEAAKLELDIEPMDAEEVTEIVKQIANASPEIIAKTKAAMALPGGKK